MSEQESVSFSGRALQRVVLLWLWPAGLYFYCLLVFLSASWELRVQQAP